MRFRDLGPLTVEIDGVERVFSGTRQAAILAMLVLHANAWVSKDRLAAAGWGIDVTVTAASVENQVSRLRRVLSGAAGPDGPPTLVNGAGGYRLTTAAGTVDSHRLEQLADLTRQSMAADEPDTTLRGAEEGLAMWRGTPYEALTDETTVAAVARLQELRAQLLERRIEALLSMGELDRVLADSDVLVAEMPFRERLWAQRMIALARSGRSEEALRTYQRARTFLVDETGLEPGAELRDLQSKILTRDPSLVVSVPRPSRSHRTGPARIQLPRRMPDLVGRAQDLGRLTGLVVDHPLVTVTGSGGCGKTRLAIEAAHDIAGSFPDGVWFVDLNAVSDPDLLVAVVVSTLGLADTTPGTTLSVLESYVRSRRVLLVLDNCEHLLTAVADLVDALLGEVSGQAVLATSREPLGLIGERIYPLAPLPVTVLPGPSDPDVAGSSPAAELFLIRARSAAPSLVLDGVDQRLLVDEMCADLDGLPLAIELAAARARSFTLTEIAAQVAVDPSRLARIGHGRDDHRRTLHEVIDWSYRLLPPAEQSLHRRLSVLPGAFTAPVARAVVDHDDVENLLAQLVHRSLLSATPPEAPGRLMSFAQLATVRAHAQHQLDEAGETSAAVDRRDRWVRALLAERPRLGMVGEAGWYDRLEDAYPTVRAALQDALAADGDTSLLRLGAGLGFFWYYRSRVLEGCRWLEDVLASRTGAGPELTPVQLVLVTTLFLSGRVEEARNLSHEVLPSIVDVPHARLVHVGEALVGAGYGAWSRNAFDVVEQLLQVLVRIAGRSEDSNLALLTRSLECVARLTAPDVDATIAAASRLYDDAVARGNLLVTWTACAVIDLIAQHTRQPALGQLWTERLITAHLPLGSGGGGVFLEALANFAAMTDDDPAGAVRLYAAAITQTRRVGMTWPFQPLTHDLFDELRGRVDDHTYQQAWREGESMTLEDVAHLRNLD